MTSETRRGNRQGARRLAAGGLLLSLALTGCVGGDDTAGGESPSPTESAGPSPTPDPRVIPTPTPAPTRTPAEACGGYPFDADAVRAYTPEGPAYAGDGVHTVEVFSMTPEPYDAGPGVPDDWAANPYNGEAQLVLCEYRNGGHEGAVVGSCTYAGGSLDSLTAGGESEVRAARYTYRVFEARTGELVDTFTLDGTTSPEDSCPAESAYPASTYYQFVESDALADALRDLVTGPA